jgi:hypothetical protein
VRRPLQTPAVEVILLSVVESLPNGPFSSPGKYSPDC